MDIKITKDCFVPKENVKLYVSYTGCSSIRKKVKEMKKDGMVFDFTGGKKTETAIFLKSGGVIVTSVKLPLLHSRMDPQSLTDTDKE